MSTHRCCEVGVTDPRSEPEEVEKIESEVLTTEAPNLQQRKTRAERAFGQTILSASGDWTFFGLPS